MKRVVKFENLDEAKQFVKDNPVFKLIVVLSRTLGENIPAKKFYVAYNKKQCAPVNNALLEYWEREGLI